MLLLIVYLCNADISLVLSAAGLTHLPIDRDNNSALQGPSKLPRPCSILVNSFFDANILLAQVAPLDNAGNNNNAIEARVGSCKYTLIYPRAIA